MDNEDKVLQAMENKEEYLEHYGTPRHSGRYPWGSGKNPQRSKNLSVRNKELKKQGVSEKQRAAMLGYLDDKGEGSINKLRAAISIADKAIEQETYTTIMKLYNKGYSKSEIGRRIGRNESVVRKYINRGLTSRTKALDSCVDILTKHMTGNTDYLDVGKGSEIYFGVRPDALNTALEVMRKKGYEVYTIPIEQLGTREKTNTKVLVPKGVTRADVFKNLDKIKPPQSTGEYVDKDTGNVEKLHDPVSINPDRVKIRYKEEGGIDKDGVMEIRPGVKDLDLKNSRYLQARIEVGGTHYLKGMAMYGDEKDFPPGVDIIFNTNKSSDIPKMGPGDKSVLKAIKDDIDPLNRFGALIDRQNDWVDENGKKHEGAVNIVRSEGQWTEWSNTIASQMLGKQRPSLAKQQLNIDFKRREDEFKEIMSLENETIKKHLLESFSDDCDGASVHLKAAAFPRQGYHVILPLPGLKENEIYAPNYKDGEKVVCIRYPHGGIFEIPELTVNNRTLNGKRFIGKNAKDAVGINPRVAERLSGADFDGDTVLVIPNNDGKIKTKDELPGLKGFDSKIYKKGDNEVPTKGHFDTQKEMGMVSNLIMDMTLQGADWDEIAAATRHSMVVIDAEKHNLDAKRSFVDNDIQHLKDLYQRKEDPTKPGGGASTLLTRAKSEARVPERKQAYTLKDPKTGEYIVKDGIEVATGKKAYRETGRKYPEYKKNPDGTLYKDANGNVVIKGYKLAEEKSTKMAETDDARTLMSGPNHEGYEMERIYADYANRCKALANQARKEMVQIKEPRKDPVAAKIYAKEVEALKAKVLVAQKNAPLERLAQRKGNIYIQNLIADDPSLKTNEKKDTLKKEKGKALQRARREVGAKKKMIELTDAEWEAVQARAISPSLLREIVANADVDKLKNRAMPRAVKNITPATAAKIKAYANNGRTQAEIAEALGISTTTVSKILSE